MTSEGDGLIGRAQALELDAVAQVLAGADRALFERRVVQDPRLGLEPAKEAPELVGQLVRRGLDPALVRALLGQWSSRPAERALLAWDVLGGALFAPGDPLLGELREAARPLAGLVQPGRAGVDLNRDPAERLITRLSPAAQHATSVELLARAAQHDLAALLELHRRGDALVRQPATREAIRAFGLALHLAHLPTLASVYLDLASRPLGLRSAARDLCEALFDAEAPEKIPADAIRRGDVPEVELSDAAEYLVYRSYLALGQAREAYALLMQNLAQRQEALGPPSAALQVVGAHLAALAGELDAAPAIVDAARERDRLWRYASRVRCVVSARLGEAPLERLHEHVSGFGNDLRAWGEALLVAPAEAGWKTDAILVLAREAFHLPHEPAAWRPLLMLLGRPPALDAAARELDARLRAQTTLR